MRSFLTSRGIELPEETVHDLGDRKNELFHRTMREDGVKVFEGSRRYLEAAPKRVSAARSCHRAPTPVKYSRSPGWPNSFSTGWTV